MMSSEGTRSRALVERRIGSVERTAGEWVAAGGSMPPAPISSTQVGKQMTVSESHRRDRSDGSYRSGGPFYTSLVRNFIKGASVKDHYNSSLNKFYSGIVRGKPPTLSEMQSVGYSNTDESYGASNEASMVKDGTTAIALVSPTNPAADLGTTLAETMREGVPSLPGIQTWKRRTEILKGLGSEYLNYQFGWAPLAKEVSDVSKAARHHRDLLSQYHRGEGSDTHRRFDFPSQIQTASLPPSFSPNDWGLPWKWSRPDGTRQVSLVKETKKWFEGVFTYALPTQDDSWGKAMGFGSDADALFGLALTPEILWELTPWSWAVDWFSNAGFVIHNVTSFGLAGLVMRYGYMMEESIERVAAEGHLPSMVTGTLVNGSEIKQKEVPLGTYSSGVESVTKRRVPASPFGFGIGWEGLSPTQLAITAALGITRLL